MSEETTPNLTGDEATLVEEIRRLHPEIRARIEEMLDAFTDDCILYGTAHMAMSSTKEIRRIDPREVMIRTKR